MKKFKYSFFSAILIIWSNSCIKTTGTNAGIASLNVVNATTGVFSMYIYFTFSDSDYYLQQNPLYYGSNEIFSAVPGQNQISVVSSSDTIKPLFQSSIPLNNGGIYSLYFAGTGSDAVDTVFLKDNIPIYSDSVAGIRFINLSPASQPMSINIQGNYPNQIEFSGIGYKQITAFKSYPATSNIPGYYFEIRDQATGTLLTTFGLGTTVYRSNTVIINGSENPQVSPGVGAFSINNY